MLGGKTNIETKHGIGNIMCPTCENKWGDLGFPESDDDTHALLPEAREKYDKLKANKEKTKGFLGCVTSFSISCFKERGKAKDDLNAFWEGQKSDPGYQRRKLDMSPKQFKEYKELEAKRRSSKNRRDWEEFNSVSKKMRELEQNANQFKFRRLMARIFKANRRQAVAPVVTKTDLFVDTLDDLIASSNDAKEIVAESKVMQQLLQSTNIDKLLVNNFVEDAMKVAASTIYMKQSQKIGGYEVCPIVLQNAEYKQSINRLLEQLEFKHNVDPSSSTYTGPASYRLGTCGAPKYFNFAGVTRVDYYPPKYCIPEPNIPITVESLYTSIPDLTPKLDVRYDKKNRRLSSLVDCTGGDCNYLKDKCDITMFNYVVKQNNRKLYTIDVTGLTYVITPLCAFDERKQDSNFRSLFYDSKLAANGS
jgi:hypothetical protein